MKKTVVFGFLAALFMVGCGEDKKAVIPTKLDNPLPQVATSGGGGDPGAGKAKGPGGSSKAD